MTHEILPEDSPGNRRLRINPERTTVARHLYNTTDYTNQLDLFHMLPHDPTTPYLRIGGNDGNYHATALDKDDTLALIRMLITYMKQMDTP